MQWYNGRPNLGALRRQGQQPWLCNIYLNAIFVPGTGPEVLDPVRREFARSVVPWRRPAQRAYVALATSRRGARWLAQAGVGISPGLPSAERWLIVPGNHKIRLLDRDNGLVYNVAKHGFPRHFMQREVAARRQAAELGLPVPRLVRVAEDGTWFSERYISGTPLNRLPDPQVARQAAANAAQSLRRLLEHTAREESLEDYVARLQRRIQTLVDSNHLLSEQQKQDLLANAETLVEQIGGRRVAVGGRITTALTHGDFQPGNMLVDGERVWLIDWEYSDRRQVGYDALVFTLRSRFPRGLAGRLQDFVDGSGDFPWPGEAWDTVERRRLYSALFLLEELALHLAENANPRFARLGEGLGMLQREIADVKRGERNDKRAG